MKIYELTHTYYIFEGEPCYSNKLLGYFDSFEKVNDAIQYYLTRPGYCDSPKGFVVRIRDVYGEVKNQTVYCAEVYAHSFDYVNYEQYFDLGIYADKAEADQAIEEFRRLNSLFLSNEKLEIEIYEAGTVIINHKYQTEGFDVEEI